jgi:hypothetical protein
MAINLVNLAMQLLTPDMVAKIASSLGVDGAAITRAAGASIPAVLAGLGGVASKPDGAKKLFDTVSQMEPGMLDTLLKSIGGASQQTTIDRGSSVLSSLLGSAGVSGLTSAVSKFAGIGQGPTSSLVGLLAPMVLGTLGKHASGLDASGLANLLGSQKDNISAALPSGFASLLSGTGLLNSVNTAANTVASGAAQATRTATTTAAPIRAAVVEDTSSSNRLYWIIPLLLLAGLAYYFLGNRQTAEKAVTTTEKAVTTAAPGLVINGTDYAAQVTTGLNNLKTALEGITDTATATAALPKLQDATTQFDKIGGMLGQFSGDQKKLLSGLIGPAMGNLNSLFDKILAIPGVATIAKPAIDSLRAKLDPLTKI